MTGYSISAKNRKHQKTIHNEKVLEDKLAEIYIGQLQEVTKIKSLHHYK